MLRSSDVGAAAGWAINGRFLTQRMTGVQRYAYEILVALDELLGQDSKVSGRLGMQLILPHGAQGAPPLENIISRQTSLGTGYAWEQLILPLYAGSGALNLCNLGPLASSNTIVCIHDANVFIEPESYSRSFGAVYRKLLPLVGKRAKRVATVSQFSAEMLAKYGVCCRDKIFVAPNGYEHVEKWDSRCAKLPMLESTSRPFVLLLGSRAKHKNIDVILDQSSTLDRAGIDIVVAGAVSNIFADRDAPLSRSNVRFLGYVTDDDLAALYERALCLVFPSKTEGFGIPPLEAMASGCPVVSSNAASLVEVGGDAVIYVPPDDGKGWGEAVIGLAGNEGFRRELSEKGRKRALLFSWKRSARQYMDEIERLFVA